MKRFSETNRFSDQWFCELSLEFKCAYEFVWASADNAGVWNANKRLADFQIGAKIDWDEFQEEMQKAGKLEVLDDGKWFLVGFINFQCGELSESCRPHLKVFELLKTHGIEYVGGEIFTKRSRRSTVSPSKRKAIFDRDGNACVYCGSTNNLQPDHIVPRKLQGSCDISNLLTACAECNNQKNDKPLAEFLSGKDCQDRVLKYVDSLSGKSHTLKDKDKDQDKDKDTPPVVKKTAVLSLVEFDRFWSIYPRKVGKEEARKAWQKAGVTFEQCEATIRTWAASEDWQKEGGRFCPHASTWLNQKRWTDAPPPQCKSEPKPKTEFWPEMKTESVMEIMERQERERLEALENQYAEDGL